MIFNIITPYTLLPFKLLIDLFYHFGQKSSGSGSRIKNLNPVNLLFNCFSPEHQL